MKKYLVVCQQNEMRSPIVVEYLKKLLKERNIEGLVKSAGLSDLCRKKLTKEIADDANIIFAIDEDVHKEIIEKYSQLPKKVVNLDILDVYYGANYEHNLVVNLCRKKKVEEWDSIWDRPEIKHRLSLYEVLEIKKCFFLQQID